MFREASQFVGMNCYDAINSRGLGGTFEASRMYIKPLYLLAFIIISTALQTIRTKPMSKNKKSVPERDFPADFLCGATFSMPESGEDKVFVNGASSRNLPLERSPKNRAVNAKFHEKIGEDFDRAGKFGLNSMQISLPWHDFHTGGKNFDQAYLSQWKALIERLVGLGIEPLLAMCEAWAQPRWFAEAGGWAHRESAEHFAHYAEKILDTFGTHCQLWIPVLEPDWWLSGVAEAQFQDNRVPVKRLKKVRGNIRAADAQCCALIRKQDSQNRVGVSVRGAVCKPQDKRSAWDLRAARRLEKKLSPSGLHGEPCVHDFLALSLGNVFEVKFDLKSFRRGFAKASSRIDVLRSESEVASAAKLLEEILQKHGMAKLPVYITGCGFPCENDTIRKRFIEESLGVLAQARASGLDIRGYFFRSLLDHFGKENAIRYRDGLVHVDASSGVRTPNPSAYFLGDIAQRGMLPVAVRKRLGLGGATAEKNA